MYKKLCIQEYINGGIGKNHDHLVLEWVQLKAHLEEQFKKTANQHGRRKLKQQMEELKEKLSLTVNLHTFPAFVYPQVPKYVPTETHDNSWNLYHGYISKDIKKHELKKWY